MSIGAARLEEVVSALRYEEDGKQLRKEMTANLKAAVEPALPEIRSGLAVIGRSETQVTPALAATVASKVRIAARFTGPRTGVRVSIGKKGMPRDFVNAPRRLNAAKGWRHPVPRRPRKDGSMPEEQWVDQMGAPGYFDDPLRARRDEMRLAVQIAVEQMSQRIARRAGRG